MKSKITNNEIYKIKTVVMNKLQLIENFSNENINKGFTNKEKAELYLTIDNILLKIINDKYLLVQKHTDKIMYDRLNK